MHHDPFGQLGQLALLALTGAFAGLARILSAYETEFTTRRILANVIGGAVVAIIAGGLYAFFFPDKEANILVVAALAAASGAIGFPWIIELIKHRVETKLAVDTTKPEEPPKRSPTQLADEKEFSVNTKNLIDSDEFNAEDIAQMVEEARARREKIKVQLGIQDESRD